MAAALARTEAGTGTVGRSSSRVGTSVQEPLLTLVAGDEDPQAQADLRTSCRTLDVTLLCCDDGASTLYQAGRHHPDVVLLSVDLPVVTAPQVISVLRAGAESMRIVVGVGEGQADRAALCIAAGASDVLSRPYRRAALATLLDGQLAQARARRDEHAILVLGDLVLDSAAYTAHLSGGRLDMTLREFELLRLLMLHADRVVSPDQIRQELWGGEPASGNTIAVHIRRIRSHLARSVTEVVTVRGVGYRITIPWPASSAGPTTGGSPIRRSDDHPMEDDP